MKYRFLFFVKKSHQQGIATPCLKKLFLSILTFLIFSCSKDDTNNKTNNDLQSSFSNLEINGNISNNRNFKLIAKKATLSKDNNLINLVGIKFFIENNKEIVYKIDAEKGSYLKSKKMIVLENNQASANKNINLTAKKINFLENTDLIKSDKINLNYYDHKISAKSLTIDKNQINFTMKDVRAKLKY